jgi:hypothetical protein
MNNVLDFVSKDDLVDSILAFKHVAGYQWTSDFVEEAEFIIDCCESAAVDKDWYSNCRDAIKLRELKSSVLFNSISFEANNLIDDWELDEDKAASRKAISILRKVFSKRITE